MKVAIVTSFPFPDGKATSNRVKVFAEELIKSNYADEVQIISITADQRSRVNLNEKIKIINIYVPIVDKKNLILRGLSEILVAFKLWSAAKKTKADIAIVTVPAFLLLIPLVIFGKPFKLVIDVRDAVWTYFPMFSLKGLLVHVLRILFKIAAKKADLVCVTNSHEEKIIEAVAGVEVTLVSNGISLEKFNNFQSIKTKCIQDRVNVTYVGNVGVAQELEVLIEFLKCYQKDIEVNIVGDGAMLSSLKLKAINENMTNIIFHGAISPDRVAQYMDKADILFAQIGKNFQSAIPTKVFEYIAAGRRVLLGLPEGAAKDTFQKFYGLEIFPVGQVSCMKKSYDLLVTKEFGVLERNYNANRLKSFYIRENSMVNFLSKLNDIIRTEQKI